ncbi:hypothetical protein CERSUDRAFT_112114 [Gelatoporia subvermispora B]|uniref:Probable 26S proteasome regulatory subunit p27 n=1 Tax=Ceriporiopsis subvermispora (strain B) TaxID=914234 RepID=M2RMZ8_CERS8|nr:hypothetical protein CERSUDRAFT_112114 [Gelatoporia subvermispora B]
MGFMLPSRETPADQVRALMARKDAIEAELDAQASILKANDSTMETLLLDADGFPRADIDVWAVRHARVRIIELRNDLAAIMDRIMEGLQNVYDSGLAAAAEPVDAPMSDSVSPDALLPFAKVDGVAPGSPAATSGLLREDLVLSFGALTRSSFGSSSLQPLAEYVATQENREVVVKVLRGANETLNLTFIPRRNWGGRGLLGCHIVPHNLA